MLFDKKMLFLCVTAGLLMSDVQAFGHLIAKGKYPADKGYINSSLWAGGGLNSQFILAENSVNTNPADETVSNSSPDANADVIQQPIVEKKHKSVKPKNSPIQKTKVAERQIKPKQVDIRNGDVFFNVITLSAGAAWENGGHSQTLFSAPQMERNYVTTSQTQIVADVELFLGRQWRLKKTLQAQLGLAMATTSDAQLSGYIVNSAYPQLQNDTYEYKINHSHLAIKGKLLWDWGYKFQPWISGSVGAGFNRSQNYSDTTSVYEAESTPLFQANTEAAFTYTLGAGIQCSLSQHLSAGVGYEFADWGGSQLVSSDGQSPDDNLSLSHLFTNALMLNFTYVA